jgi:hypothetical protein
MVKNIMKGLFIKTAIITLLIFGAGIMFGLWISQEKVGELEQTTTSLKSSIENAELQFALLDILEPEIACNYLATSAKELGKKAASLAKDVERFESSQRIDESDFIELKKEYTSTLIKDWVVLEKIKDTCNSTYITVLYFYSNENCDKCLDQGIVLTHIKDQLEQDIMIFALDSDLGLLTVDALRDSYGIEKYPALIIENVLYPGYLSLEELTSVLCSHNKELEIC